MTTDMTQEKKLHFNGSWRSYQKRILDQLELHLRDKKLHVVAAQGLIKTSLNNVGISVFERLGQIYVSCANLSSGENKLFMQAMQEFLNPIDNPRFLLVKHGMFMNWFNQTDYFSVPSILSSNKKDVKIFEQIWNKYIGGCEIVYTRNLNGRKLLLKARKYASSSMKRMFSKRLSKWQ